MIRRTTRRPNLDRAVVQRKRLSLGAPIVFGGFMAEQLEHLRQMKGFAGVAAAAATMTVA
jgi:hypothetical protein